MLRMSTAKVQSVPSEHQEQAVFVALVRLHYPEYSELLMAIPNGGLRNKRVAAKLKAEGVLPGAPDLFLARTLKGCGGLFIEMKRIKGSSTSQVQKDLHINLRGQGYRVEVAKGATAAMEIFEEYTGMEHA
jgi:hypothetical protein